MHKHDAWHSGFATMELNRLYNEELSWPKVLLLIKNEWEFFKKELVLSTLSAVFMYLKSILILDRILMTCTIKIYDIKTQVQKHMIIDSQAFQHLELLELK